MCKETFFSESILLFHSCGDSYRIVTSFHMFLSAFHSNHGPRPAVAIRCKQVKPHKKLIIYSVITTLNPKNKGSNTRSQCQKTFKITETCKKKKMSSNLNQIVWVDTLPIDGTTLAFSHDKMSDTVSRLILYLGKFPRPIKLHRVQVK